MALERAAHGPSYGHIDRTLTCLPVAPGRLAFYGVRPNVQAIEGIMLASLTEGYNSEHWYAAGKRAAAK